MKKLRLMGTMLAAAHGVVILAGFHSVHVDAIENLAARDTLATRPNILMILVDDLGYTDLGSYGGNIGTTNIDQIAEEGFRFSNAHAYPTCAPSRASLITGKDPHRVGMGGQNGMTPVGVSPTAPGYTSVLEGDFVGIAQLMRDSGYRTYQSGKWHLGDGEKQLPMAVGFDRHFSLLDGAASHYNDMLPVSLRVTPSGKVTYMRDGQTVDALPEDFYSTRNYTDEIIAMIDGGREEGKPFFAYLAYTAVHDPLHAPEEYIKKYYDSFNKGFESLRQDRVKGLARHGLITDGTVATAWLKEIPDWENLTDKQKSDLARRMAVYAAMVDYMDGQIGRVVEYLKQTGEYENTLIVIASDNGAAGTPKIVYTQGDPDDLAWQNTNYFLNSIADYGRKGSFPTMGSPNAQASSGPYHSFKSSLHEGGTRIPLIMKLPNRELQNRELQNRKSPGIITAFFHLSDLYPTFAEVAGANVEGQRGLQGMSFHRYLAEPSISIPERGFGMEYMGLRSYRKGDWKLLFVPEAIGGKGDYALYNLASDPGEVRDLSKDHPELVRELSMAWFDYASKNNVIVVPMESVNTHYGRAGPLFLSIDWGE